MRKNSAPDSFRREPAIVQALTPRLRGLDAAIPAGTSAGAAVRCVVGADWPDPENQLALRKYGLALRKYAHSQTRSPTGAATLLARQVPS